ncbi:MAG: sugar kinase [Tractidigestivibacter sp.]|uniref:sugar kinase n=1 Tax=Tractidigestivibacter sp. TaxID=2847320 RepID=UPI002A8348AB|nr:sugar kinase [Tractidigestivibacter sp.]MDY4533738.1 sugar kinase [Tractidigestivibacter sp.]
MDANAQVLAFGEIMMRLSPPDNLRIEQASSFDVRYGGAEANAALSLAFQGDRAAYMSVVPANRLGDCALRSLVAYGVDVSRVVRAGDRLGSYVFEVGASMRGNGVVYDRKYSAISLASHKDLDWDAALDGVGVFYVSGVTPAISAEMAIATREAFAACRERGVVTVVDVNYRGKMWSPERSQEVMEGLLPLADVCIANDEDAPRGLGITCVSGSLDHGIEEREDYVEMARQISSRFGCKQVLSVIRNISSVESSEWMAMLYRAEGDDLLPGAAAAGGEHVFSPVYPVHVLEGVGGGDAFSAAYLHALLHGYEPQRAIDYAIAGSVLKLTVRGDANLVSEAEISAVAASAGGGTRVAR